MYLPTLSNLFNVHFVLIGWSAVVYKISMQLKLEITVGDVTGDMCLPTMHVAETVDSYESLSNHTAFIKPNTKSEGQIDIVVISH